MHPHLAGASPRLTRLCYDLIAYPYGSVKTIITRLRISARAFEKEMLDGCQRGLILKSCAGASTYLIPMPKVFEAFGFPCPYDLTSVEHSYYLGWNGFYLSQDPAIKTVYSELKIRNAGHTSDLVTLGYNGTRWAYEVTLSPGNCLSNCTKYADTDFDRIVFICRDHKLRDAVKASCCSAGLDPQLLAKLDFWHFGKLLRRPRTSVTP